MPLTPLRARSQSLALARPIWYRVGLIGLEDQPLGAWPLSIVPELALFAGRCSLAHPCAVDISSRRYLKVLRAAPAEEEEVVVVVVVVLLLLLLPFLPVFVCSPFISLLTSYFLLPRRLVELPLISLVAEPSFLQETHAPLRCISCSNQATHSFPPRTANQTVEPAASHIPTRKRKPHSLLEQQKDALSEHPPGIGRQST